MRVRDDNWLLVMVAFTFLVLFPVFWYKAMEENQENHQHSDAPKRAKLTIDAMCVFDNEPMAGEVVYASVWHAGRCHVDPCRRWNVVTTAAVGTTVECHDAHGNEVGYIPFDERPLELVGGGWRARVRIEEER